jgi:hypothetical protein
MCIADCKVVDFFRYTLTGQFLYEGLMRFTKCEFIDIDVPAERARINEFFEAGAAQPMLQLLNALESSDLATASRLYSREMASSLCVSVGDVIRAYRSHQKDPQMFEHPRLQLDAGAGTFSNPNDVRAQHSYALHVLAGTRYALAKMAVALQELAGNEASAQEQVSRAAANLKAANGAAENDVFKLEEVDGKLTLSFG